MEVKVVVLGMELLVVVAVEVEVEAALEVLDMEEALVKEAVKGMVLEEHMVVAVEAVVVEGEVVVQGVLVGVTEAVKEVELVVDMAENMLEAMEEEVEAAGAVEVEHMEGDMVAEEELVEDMVVELLVVAEVALAVVAVAAMVVEVRMGVDTEQVVGKVAATVDITLETAIQISCSTRIRPLTHSSNKKKDMGTKMVINY